VEDVGVYASESYWQKAKLVRNGEEWAALKGEPVLKSYYAFYKEGTEKWLAYLRAFKMKEIIVRQAEATFSHWWAVSTVGVHIRRTDNKTCIEKSPSPLFWKKMAEYPEDVRFFVASDSKEEKDILHRRFPGRILAYSEVLDRSTPYGCLVAVLEFYCLSQCKEILGSYKSSFSEVSAAYGGAALIAVTE